MAIKKKPMAHLKEISLENSASPKSSMEPLDSKTLNKLHQIHSRKSSKFYSRLIGFFHNCGQHQHHIKKDCVCPVANKDNGENSEKGVSERHVVPLIEGKTIILRPQPPKLLRFFEYLGRKLSNDENNSKKLAKGERLSEKELEIVKQKLPSVRNLADLSFGRKYQFVGTKVIGRGASGVVRLATCTSCMDRVVAVKEFRRRRKDESPAAHLAKLAAEYCLASRLHHCNVVETVDMVHDGSHWYEVMEYCEGGDLFSAIQGGELGMDEISCCFKQLVEGVHYLHSLGIAHRDLKPENLLIDSRGHLKITDFGVSDEFNACEPRKFKGPCGSSPYIAPEEFKDAEYDARLVDVWAVGIIYYAMVYHRVPWEVADPAKDANYAHFIEHGFAGFEPIQRLPHGPRNLLQRILEPDPSSRITVDEIMQDKWFIQIVLCSIPTSNCDRANNASSLVAEDEAGLN